MSGIVGQNLGRGSGLIKATSVTLGNDSIDSQHYVDASIDNAHLADDAVGVAELSATGTASSSTFLRGDNAWAAAGGSGRILQTAMKQYGDSVSTSSTSYVYMTPMGRSFASLDSTSSKILVSLTGGTIGDGSDTGSYRFYGQINDTGGFSAISSELARPHESNNRYGNIAMQFLWSPNTTDKVEVQVWGKSIGGGTVKINVADVNIVLLMYEIGG